MKEYRYKFDNTQKRICPQCGQKTFVGYIDTQTMESLSDEFGRCDREINCGYFRHPYGKNNLKIKGSSEKINFAKSKPIKAPVFIPKEILIDTQKDYEENTFIQNLLSKISYPIDIADINKVVGLYHLGTIDLGAGQRVGSHRGYATTFPFIDRQGNVRTIQAKQFDSNNHTIRTSFVHAILEGQHIRRNKQCPQWINEYKENEIKVSCLFGAHLLNKYPKNPIALVEAPKTAIYGTLYFGFPDNPSNMLWLAVYNLSSLNLNKCKELAGRDVYLFPDLSKNGRAFDLWSKKAKQLELEIPHSRFIVSDLLEKNAGEEEREKGSDLADFLIKQDWRRFRK